MSDQLKSASLVAIMGSTLVKDKKKQNAWKKRFIDLVPGIDFPDDFDLLSEDEKQRRLDAAIKVGLTD